MDVEKEIGLWRDRIKRGEEFRQLFAYEQRWESWKQYLRNEFSERVIPVNMFFPLIRSSVARIYLKNPSVVVTATKPGMWWQAKIVEQLDNWLIKKVKLKKPIKKMAQTTMLLGTAICKSGYDSEFGFDPESSKAPDPTTQKMIEQGTWEEEEESFSGEFNDLIFPGMPFSMHIDPGDFVVPEGCREIETAEYVVFQTVRHIDDIRADSRYEHAREIEPTRSIKSTKGKPGSIAYSAEKDGFVLLHEIQDKRSGRIKVIAEGYNQGFLRNLANPLTKKGFDYDTLVFNPDQDYFWGNADSLFLEPQQLERNEIRTQLRDQRVRDLIKFLCVKGIIGKDALEKLESGESFTFIEILGGPEDLAKAIYQFQPHFSNHLLAHDALTEQNAREMLGFSRNQAGEFDRSSRRTAREATIVAQSAMIRIDERVDAVADLVVDILRRYNSYIFRFWSGERYAQIVGPQGEQWVSYRGADLTGDYDYVVDLDAVNPISSELRKAERMEALSLAAQIAPNVPQVAAMIPELLKQVFSSYRTLGLEDAPVMDLSQMGGGGGASNASVPVSLSELLTGNRGAG